MRALLLVVLYVALRCPSSESLHRNIDTLMDHVLVLQVPHGVPTRIYVPLTCGAAYQNQSVFWKKDGYKIVVSVEPSPALQGNNISVLVEEMDGGNYTCHLRPTGKYLNHTLVLIQLDPDNATVILEKNPHGEGHIHCSALNYKGSFHCSWTRTLSRSDAGVVLVKAERNGANMSCELDADGSGVHCRDANCPYEEEQHRVLLVVYMRSHWRLEANKKAFFLRDIVRPARLPNLQDIEGSVFSWDYPESWEKPCSFFGLLFQVKVVRHGDSCDSREHIKLNITEETTYKVNVKNRRYIFCVRAQDKYTKGPWSHWSQHVVNKHRISR